MAQVQAPGAGADAQKSEQRSERPPRNSERGERGRGGERGNRGERSERPERTDNRADGRGEARSDTRPDARPEGRAEGRPEGRPEGRNEPRADRPPREDNDRSAPAESDRRDTSAMDIAQAAPRADNTPVDGEQGNGSETREKRSRDRYGRERRERGPRQEQAPQEGTSPELTNLDTAAAPAAAPVAAAPASPVRPVPVPVAAPAPQVQTAAVPRELPKVENFALPLGELAQVAESSGLQWVNSDAAKIAAVQAAIAAEPKALHVPRERPAPVQIDQGPLVLVETKRDLNDMTLPFEKTTTS